MNVKGRIASSAAEFVLAAAAVCLALLCPASAFDFPDMQPALLCACLTALVCTVLFSLKPAWILFAASGAALALAFLIFRETLTASFTSLGRYLIANYNDGYHWLGDVGIWKNVSPESFSPALMMLAAAMGWLAAFAAVRVNSAVLLFAVCAPCVFSCYMLLDLAPKTLPVLLLAGVIALLAFSQGAMKRSPDRAWQPLLCRALPVALLFALLIAIWPEREYRQTEVNRRLSVKLEQVREDIEKQVLGKQSLNEKQQVNLKNETFAPSGTARVMTVTAGETGTLYLRGMVYERFDGTNWTAADDTDRTGPVYTEKTDNTHGRVAYITTESAGNVFYTPYYFSAVPAGAVLCRNGMLENPGGVQSYAVRYGDAVRTDASAGWSSLVKETCTELPDGLADGLRAWWEKNADGAEPTPENITERIRGTASYSRNASVMPEGAQFTLWFLNDAEYGYCVHYASAAAAMLRAFGYPARVATGFVTDVRAGVRTDVAAKNGHAWVELFEEGTGWIPLDPTPGEGVPAGDGNPAEAVLAERKAQREPRETEEPETAGRPEETKHAPSKNPDREPQSAETSGQTGGAEKTGAEKNGPPALLLIAAILLLLLTSVVLQRILRLAVRGQREKKMNTNALVCSRYRVYERRCAMLHRRPDKEAKRIAQKAGFSGHALTPEEAERFEALSEQAAEKLRRGNFFRMLWCRYGLAIL